MEFCLTVPYVMAPATKRTKMLSVRVSDEEMARVKEVAARVKAKNRFVEEADVIRELLGLENNGLITAELRRMLLPLPPPTHEIKQK
jgi:hypothetical protein